MLTRDLEAEKAAVDQFIGELGRKPTSSADWDKVHGIAYAPENMPDEFKTITPPPTLAPTGAGITGLPQTAEQSGIGTMRGNIDVARSQYEQYTQPTYALNILQDAIKEKTGFAQRGIGESEIFKKAGVGGVGALSQSLAATGKAMQMDAVTFENTINSMTGQYRDTALAARERYNNAMEEYEFEANRLQGIADRAESYRQQIELADKADKAQRDLLLYKQQLSGGIVTGKPFPVTGTATQIADAIKQVESGGDYGISGGSGEYGAYQFMPGTWDSWSKEYLAATGQPTEQPLDMSAENQDAVAQFKIQQWLGQGYTPAEIAATWNSGSPTGWENKVGTNSAGVPYNVPEYVNKVASALSSIVGTQDNIIPAQLDNYNRSILTARLGKQIYGTRISDKESARVEGFITSGSSLGRTEYQIIDDVLGYKVEKNKELGDSLRNILLQYGDEGGLSSFDMLGLARLLNSDDTTGAINKVEKQILERSEDGLPRETAAIYAQSKGNTVLSSIQNNLNKLGIVAGTYNKYKKKFLADTNFQSIESGLTALITEWRNKMVGSNVTENEEKFLEGLIASVQDNPYNAMQKIREFQKMNIEQNNAIRNTYNLPELDGNSLLNRGQRTNLYLGGGTKKPVDGLSDEEAYDMYLQISGNQ